MITYHCASNNILHTSFSDRKNKHKIQAYRLIMKRLAYRGHKVDVKILDNEVSADFKRVIVDDWGATYQLVPPNVLRQNIDKKSIRTFKTNVLLVLDGVDSEFPNCVWENLLGQIDLTLNLLCEATLNPHI